MYLKIIVLNIIKLLIHLIIELLGKERGKILGKLIKTRMIKMYFAICTLPEYIAKLNENFVRSLGRYFIIIITHFEVPITCKVEGF